MTQQQWALLHDAIADTTFEMRALQRRAPVPQTPLTQAVIQGGRRIAATPSLQGGSMDQVRTCVRVCCRLGATGSTHDQC